jgi:hypothetical protein
VVARQPAINSVFSSTFQIGGYFTDTIVFNIPSLIAGAGTTVVKTITFGSSNNQAGNTAWPKALTLTSNQVAYILVTGFNTAPVNPSDTALIVSPMVLAPTPNSAWYYIGPKSVGTVGAQLSATFYNSGGAAYGPGTISYTIQAILFGGSTLPAVPTKNPKTP